MWSQGISTGPVSWRGPIRVLSSSSIRSRSGTTGVEVRYPAVRPLLNALGNPTQEQLVIGGMGLLIAVFVVKVWFVGLIAWRQARFVFDVQASLSHRLFAGYLREPYAFHLQRN